MSNQNDLPPHAHPPCASQPAPLDRALAAWLSDTPQPSAIAIIWRLWLPHTRAAALLAELHQLGLPLSVLGILDQRGVRLYLWQHTSVPSLHQRLLADDPNAMPADPSRSTAGQCGPAGARWCGL